jgi:hypothetical protein
MSGRVARMTHTESKGTCPAHSVQPVLLVDYDPEYPDAGTLYRCPVNGCLWAAWKGVDGWDVLLSEAVEAAA